jgi:signal transduction histidine kinase
MPASSLTGLRGGRLAAILAASLVPAALDATRSLGHGATPDLSAAVITTIRVLLVLVVLAIAFEIATRGRVTGMRCFVLVAAVALGASIGVLLLASAVSSAFDVALVEPEHRGVAIAIRMGVADAVVALGLFAMAVALPLAASTAREAERLRVAAELARLRANLHPHFLFNTLSTVSGLIGEDPSEARRMIGTLGELLHDSLGDADETRRLDEEVVWLQRYASIIETRHRGAITFRWDIDESARPLRVPRLLLQPLIENAVKHGALRRREGGEVSVCARLENGHKLTCIVEDNGPGLTTNPPRSGALGIDLVARRLALRYGSAAEFRLEAANGRTRSVVALPAEPA